jgi:hypothetical protein
MNSLILGMNTYPEKNTGTGQSYEEHTISIDKANIIALVLIIPVTLIYALPYYLLWHENIFSCLKLINLAIFLISLPVGIILHELLHGVTWALFSPIGFRSVSFGIKWQYLTPYCHCSEPLKVWQYIVGGLMPLIFMGILPATYSLLIGNKLLMFFAMFFTWTSGGDIQVVWMLRKFGKNQLVMDHPNDPGFFVIKETH